MTGDHRYLQLDYLHHLPQGVVGDGFVMREKGAGLPLGLHYLKTIGAMLMQTGGEMSAGVCLVIHIKYNGSRY